MSAFRFVRQLRQEGFLDENDEPLRLVRREELLRRWQAAHLRGAPELPLRWIIPRKSERQLLAALHSYSAQPNVKREPAPRACLGLFAAAESLGFGFVHGVPPYFYLESLDREVLSRMGLSPEGAEQRPDVYVRIPAFRESVFRAAVVRDGVPVADILQVWLDVELPSGPRRGTGRRDPPPRPCADLRGETVMAVQSDVEYFARLVDALEPWLDQVVIIGGWAHRLYRLHPLAQPLDYEPLGTFDTDIAVPLRHPVC